MNYLTKNVIDQVLEAELKLGFEKEAMTLYFNDIKKEEIENDILGDVVISKDGKRYALTLPEETVVKIHQNYKPGPFLKELIDTVNNHDKTMNDVLSVFRKYNAVIRKCNDSEGNEYMSDYIADINGYVYLLKDDDGHISYHRFLKNDFDNL